jgi:hypothetical protein
VQIKGTVITSVQQSFDSSGPSRGAESQILLVGGGWIKVFGIKSGERAETVETMPGVVARICTYRADQL